LALVLVEGARKPGDFYLFDTVANSAAYLASRGDAIDDDKLGEVRLVQFKARDGVLIDGMLTLPYGSSGKSLPLIVNPHGGPIGISDDWQFNAEAQLLAAHGYAVLQVNYRGSGGYGRSFEELGYHQWGRAMQDDLTDATHWAVNEGIADPQRMCIYGASYGGYAALMGVAKEPSLYRCAVGYVGFYDIQAWRKESDTAQRRSSTATLDVEMGTDTAAWASTSPARLAGSIKVPVFLAAGGQDKRTTQLESERMRDALTAAGNPPEWLAFKTEGHGYYTVEHQTEFYSKLLDFLDRNIGSKASH
jgi:dipeptidyl aminopeptidase/acylaminoacyl peptidase